MSITTCRSCGHKWLRTANQVCLNCGVCPDCGKEIDPADRKCPYCLGRKTITITVLSCYKTKKGDDQHEGQVALVDTSTSLSGTDYLAQGKGFLIRLLSKEGVVMETTTSGGMRISPREYNIDEFFRQFSEVDEEVSDNIMDTLFEWLGSTDTGKFDQAMKIALVLLLDKEEYFIAREDKLKIISTIIRSADFVKVKEALTCLGLLGKDIEVLRQALSLTSKGFKEIKQRTGGWGIVASVGGPLALLYYSYQVIPPNT